MEWIEGRLRAQRYPLVYYLIGANVGIYLLHRLGGPARSLVTAFLPLDSQHPRLTALVGHAFTHFGVFHLAFNMLTLYFFGKHIEALFGPRRLLVLYLLGATAGGLLHIFTSGGTRQRTIVGASGANSALLSFFVANFPYEKMFIFPVPVPLPAWTVGLGLLAYSMLMLPNRTSYVSHSAHIGGFLSGVGYYYFLRRRF